MKYLLFKHGDRVKWKSSFFKTIKGTIYRIDKREAAVLPDNWPEKKGILVKLDKLVRL